MGKPVVFPEEEHMQQIYLVQVNKTVRVFYSEDEVHAAGFAAAGKVVSEAEFNGNGCYARIIDGEIVVGLTEAEKAAQEQDARIAEIKAQLAEIDRLDGPRPIREAVAQLAGDAGLDTAYLMRHEDEAIALREQLAALGAGSGVIPGSL
jgi:hypothetical protein